MHVMFDQYFPTPHSAHAVAPTAWFVIEPEAHSVHAVGLLEYSPTAHSVQLVAPADEPVSVIEPAWHGKQKDCLSELW
jgi:hypothetical protein